MRLQRHSIHYGEHIIDFVIVRRARKTLEIAVEPDASVTVTAPLDVSLEAIERKVGNRAPWIRRQQRYFVQFLPRKPDRQYVSGETFLYLGRQYRLKIVPHTSTGVKLLRGFIEVQAPQKARTDVVRSLMETWYRERARVKFSERLEVNLERFPTPEDFRPKGLIIRLSNRRWGSMSSSSRLMLNRRLIEAPLESIDYVITHELCHIAVPNHRTEFYHILGQVMPDWQNRKHRLERTMA